MTVGMYSNNGLQSWLFKFWLCLLVCSKKLDKMWHVWNSWHGCSLGSTVWPWESHVTSQQFCFVIWNIMIKVENIWISFYKVEYIHIHTAGCTLGNMVVVFNKIKIKYVQKYFFLRYSLKIFEQFCSEHIVF